MKFESARSVFRIITVLIVTGGLIFAMGCDGLFADLDDVPEIGEPDAGEPDAESLDAADPDVDEPDTGEPDVDEPDTGEPDADEPDTGEPDAADPDATEPDATNACGGTMDLEGEPGEPCGDPCGEWTCNNDGDVECLGGTDLMSDPENCGQCGTTCSESEICYEALCQDEFHPITAIPTCDDSPPPLRCGQNAEDVSWAPASRITELVLADSEDEDLEAHNGLATVLESFEDSELLNDTLSDQIVGGQLIYVLEHDGITDLENSDSYTMNFFEGLNATEDVEIDPDSIDEGGHPLGLFPEAVVEDGVLSADSGQVHLDLALFTGGSADEVRTLPIYNAEIEADIDEEASELSGDGGVKITNGVLIGVITLADIIDDINSQAANCDCMENPQSMLTYDETDPTGVSCTLDPDLGYDEACEGGGQICEYLEDNCASFPIFGTLGDIDTIGDEKPDAISVAFRFSASGIVISGVSEDN